MMFRESTKSRYCFNTCVYHKVGRRVTIADRIRKWLAGYGKDPEIYPVTGYCPAIYPEK